MARLQYAAILTAALAALAGCGREQRAPAGAATVVVAATREPAAVLPPVVRETVGRDIGDLVFERLADLAPGGSPLDTSTYRPRLAAGWERVDSVTWRFRLRPGARWHDGQPVTAADVAFSFEAFADTLLGSVALDYLGGGQVRAMAEADGTVLVRFARAYPEQLYDATYHVRVIPRHVWAAVPRDQWEGDTAAARLVGSGPYRFVRWERGVAVTLAVDTTAAARPAIARVVWRFAADPEAALRMVRAGEADLLETTTSPEALASARADTAVTVLDYPAAVIGFLGFRLADPQGRPHPVLGDRQVRRALTHGIDRRTLADAVVGPGTAVPVGPLSRLLWINDTAVRVLPFDTAAARAALDAAGWLADAGGVRRRGGKPLTVEILVPGSSRVRRDLAVAVQEAWRRIGVSATVAAVDFPVFQQRLAAGRFDAFIGAWLDEPSPRGIAPQWTRAGWGGLNYGRYASAAFDSLAAAAGATPDRARAAALWREALDTLNADAPAVFLYNPTNHALVRRGLEGVAIDPFSWLSGLPGWRVGAAWQRWAAPGAASAAPDSN